MQERERLVLAPERLEHLAVLPAMGDVAPVDQAVEVGVFDSELDEPAR